VDAWFNGFNDHLVATAWVGFDQLKPLGRREAGGVAALPMWMYFFEELLPDLPEIERPVPDGLVTMRIDRKTGEPVSGGENTEFEVFRKGTASSGVATGGTGASRRPPRATASGESLF
jgi:penicillin-binding protein 1A